MTGNFGVSYSEGQDVRALIGERLPATLELALVSLLIAAIGGVALGIYASIRPGGAASRAISGTVLLASSLPTFLVGILLIHLFAVQLRVLPSFGRGEVVEFDWWSTGLLTDSGRRALILPAITLAVFLLALIMRLVQAGMIEQLRSDHVRFARARGLSAFSVRVRHAFRNTLVPVIIALGLQAGVIISFSIVTETVFRWPGLGLLFVNAVRFADIPVISAYVLLVAVVFVASNLVADLAAARIDPRLRIGALRPASRDLPI
jgi:peptide/nickel transport system permease protein